MILCNLVAEVDILFVASLATIVNTHAHAHAHAHAHTHTLFSVNFRILIM